jgi:hypothetical protein
VVEHLALDGEVEDGGEGLEVRQDVVCVSYST